MAYMSLFLYLDTLDQYKSVLSRWNASLTTSVGKDVVRVKAHEKRVVPPSIDSVLGGKSPSIEPVIAVLVIACNRVDYIRQTLDNLLK